MKRFILLALMGLGFLHPARSQDIMKRRHYQMQFGAPSQLAGDVLNGQRYGIPFIDTTGGTWRWRVRDWLGRDSTLAGGGSLVAGNYVVQNGNATLNQLKFTGGFMGAVPPVGSTLNPNDYVLALNSNDASNNLGFRAYPVRLFTFRSTASAPTAWNSPGSLGDVFPDATNSKLYLYLPRPGNTSGWTRINNADSTFNAPSGLPAPPTLAAPTWNGGQIQLTWTHPGGVDGFELFRSVGNATSFGVLVNPAASARAHTDPTPTTNGGTVIYYRIRAYNSVGTSAFSAQVSVTVPTVTPTVPIAPVATALNYEVDALSGPLNALSWTHSGAMVDYFEVWKKVGAAAYVNLGNFPKDARQLKFPSEAPGVTVAYKLKAVNFSAGASGFSNEVSLTIPVGNPWTLVITELPGMVGVLKMRLTWAAGFGAGVAPIRYYRKLNSGAAELLNTQTTGLSPGGFRNWEYTMDSENSPTELYVAGESGGTTYTSPSVFVNHSGGTLSVLTRPQPNSTALVPAPELEGPDNETGTLGLSRLPSFQMPTGLASHWYVSSTAQEALTLLDKGVSIVLQDPFDVSGLTSTGKNVIGASVPSQRRARMMGGNSMRDVPGSGSQRWYDGQLPQSNDDRNHITGTALGYAAYNPYDDGKPAGTMVYNFEADAAPGVDKNAWEAVKRDQILLPLKAARGGSTFPSWHEAGYQGAPWNGVWGPHQDFFMEHGYHKTRFAYGSKFSVPHDFWDFYQVLWERQGAWSHHSVQNVEWGIAQGYPKPIPLNAPYHEDGQEDTDREPFYKYYKLRPDVAENWAPLAILSGAKGAGLWNVGRRGGEWWNTEERFLRGLWRVAQHADIFDGTGQQYVTPEFSLDGGATWRRAKQGSEWGGFKYSMMDGYVPYQGNPPYNPQLIIPPLADRLIVKAVIKSGKILVGAIDPWNYQGTTLDIKVRYAGLNDNVRLYGRALYLGKTTLGVEIWLIVLLLPTAASALRKRTTPAQNRGMVRARTTARKRAYV